MERTTFPGPSGPVPAWTSEPAFPTGRGVVLLQEVFGVKPWIRRTGDALTRWGFSVVAPEVFHRAEPGFEVDYDDAGLQRGRAHLAAIDRDAFRADVRAAHAWLRSRGCDKVAVLGWCMGGLLAWEAHAAVPFDAAVVYYGARMTLPDADGLRPVDRAATMRGPVLCHYGAKDPSIPPEMVAAVTAALAGANVRATVELHPDAGHGFACEDRADHAPEAAATAWHTTLEFLRHHLG